MIFYKKKEQIKKLIYFLNIIYILKTIVSMNTELNEIKQCMSFLRQNQDITYYGLEADAVNILILLAKYKHNDDFEYACECINKTPTPNERYRDVIFYLLSYIDNEKHKRNSILIGIFDDWHINILKKYK